MDKYTTCTQCIKDSYQAHMWKAKSIVIDNIKEAATYMILFLASNTVTTVGIV